MAWINPCAALQSPAWNDVVVGDHPSTANFSPAADGCLVPLFAPLATFVVEKISWFGNKTRRLSSPSLLSSLSSSRVNTNGWSTPHKACEMPQLSPLFEGFLGSLLRSVSQSGHVDLRTSGRLCISNHFHVSNYERTHLNLHYLQAHRCKNAGSTGWMLLDVTLVK